MSETTDPGSLSRLHDIVLPDPVFWWPPAPSWYVLVTLLLLTLALGAWWGWQRWQARRYRRQALDELRVLRERNDDPKSAATQILIILKRTALVGFPRAEVARLSGGPWWAFLDRTGADTTFASDFGPLATELAYGIEQSLSADEQQLNALFSVAERWIVTHQTPGKDASHAAV